MRAYSLHTEDMRNRKAGAQSKPGVSALRLVRKARWVARLSINRPFVLANSR
jgi:hypothetical protein